MLKVVVYTCRLHTRDMFDEMSVIASRDLVKGLFKYLHLHHCFLVIFLFWRCHSILSSNLGAQILGTLSQHWQKESLDASMQDCESNWESLDVVPPIAWERLGLNLCKSLVGPKGKLFEVLDWFWRVLKLMLNDCMVCFHRFHFLNVT